LAARGMFRFTRIYLVLVHCGDHHTTLEEASCVR
jgi:hypothetical protein